MEPAALFSRLLGDAYDALPGEVRRFHSMPLPCRFEGEATVRAAANPAARLAARMLGLPLRNGKVPIAVSIDPEAGGQRWTRHFPPWPMTSLITAHEGLLCERLGPVTLRFRMHGDAVGIRWELLGVSFLGIPLPRGLFADTQAREWAEEGRYRFLAGASLPGLGELVRYEGWLDVA